MLRRPSIHELTRRQRFGLLAVLYFSQGLPFGLFIQALPVILREQGVSLEGIGFSALLALPWALKFLWAPWVDGAPMRGRLPRRKGWIVPIQILTAALFFAVAALGLHDHLAALLAAVFVVNLLNATQDIATDGLAVDILHIDERGAGNSLQVGGYRLGMIAGGAGVLLLIESLGWTAGLLASALILSASLAPLLLVREEARWTAPGARQTPVAAMKLMAGFFERRWAYVVLIIAGLWKFGDSFSTGMLRPLLVDQGYSMGDIGVLLGGVGFTAGLLGAVAGGVLADRLSRLRALIWAAVIQTLGAVVYLPLVLMNPTHLQVHALIAVEHFNGGVATVVLFACMMDWARPRHSGTDYTLLASVVVFSTGLAQVLSGISAGQLGYGGHFILAIILTAAGGALSVLFFAVARRMERSLDPKALGGSS
ncbi:MAG: MFS transporter [Bradymonadaceae bacterium]